MRRKQTWINVLTLLFTFLVKKNTFEDSKLAENQLRVFIFHFHPNTVPV